MNRNDRYIVAGMDIGGTKSEVAVSPARFPDANTLRGPGANLKTDGFDHVVDTVISTMNAVLSACRYDGPVRLVAGIAGGGREVDRKELETIILSRNDHTITNVVVESDAELILETAFHGGSGIAIVTGTGSGVYARSLDNRFCRAGGWGSILGDPGSGHDIGSRGLRAAASAMDADEATALTDILEREFSIANRRQLIDAVYEGRMPPAAFAPAVLSIGMTGDDQANRIVETSVEALAADVSALLKHDYEFKNVYALFGGLVLNTWYKERLEHALDTILNGFERKTVTETASSGALRLAQKKWPGSGA